MRTARASTAPTHLLMRVGSASPHAPTYLGQVAVMGLGASRRPRRRGAPSRPSTKGGPVISFSSEHGQDPELDAAAHARQPTSARAALEPAAVRRLPGARRATAVGSSSAVMLGGFWLYKHFSGDADTQPAIAYTSFYQELTEQKVESVTLRGQNVLGKFKAPTDVEGHKLGTFRSMVPEQEDRDLLPLLREKGVKVDVRSEEQPARRFRS